MKEAQWKLRWIRLGEETSVDGQLPLLAQPFPPREESDVAELASSVRLHGVLAPILMREVRGGLQVICGHRRYRAALAAGIDRMPAIITRMEDPEAIRCYLAQKLVRRPFSLQVQDQAIRILRDLRAKETSEDARIEVPEAAGEVTRLGDVESPSRMAADDDGDSLMVDRLAETAPPRESDMSVPADPRTRRATESILKRVESIFDEALVRRVLPADRVESVIDSIIALAETSTGVDWTFLVPTSGGADPTPAHAVLVCATCHRVTRFLGYGPGEGRDLVTAALLLDVGMVFVREAVSGDSAVLETSDNNFLKSHPRIGSAIIESTAAWNEEVAACARDHHERSNGSGYPAGKRETEVSPAARLLALLDSYCAMTSPRPHRGAFSPAAAWMRLGRSVEAGLFDKCLYRQLHGLFWQQSTEPAAVPEPKKPHRSLENSIENAPDLVTMPSEGSR